jgi:hypothetical protein
MDEGVLFRNAQTLYGRSCSFPRPHLISYIAILLILLVLTSPAQTLAGEARLYPDSIPYGSPYGHQTSGKKSMLEARTGYLWGFNEIRFRDGDNANIFPGKQEVGLDSMIFGLQGETFATDDLAVRAQAWLNIPHENRSDFYVDRTVLGWDTQARYFQADLAAIYHIGLRGMPYAAGLVAGVRYNNFDYSSRRVAAPGGTFNDHLHVYIPYTGVYYAHNDFLGSVVRLDVFFSPFTFSRLDASQNINNSVMQVDGHSITGCWFETLFEWSKMAGENILIGAFGKYDYLELSGGATLTKGGAATRFSMDSWHHLFRAGLGLTYMF